MSFLSTTSISIPDLRDDFDGARQAPEDAGYDQARKLFYGKWDRRPAAIIRPTGAGEVARVVGLARETGLPLAVRSGGHSLAGHSVAEGGIVLDLSELTAIDVDPQARTAWAQTGLTAGAYTAAVGARGLATGFGDTGSVGIGGLTLGGGVGFLVRKHGLTIDNLLAAELVTADGQVLEVDDQRYPDLFWAIRGGGGNFGVATCFQYRLHERLDRRRHADPAGQRRGDRGSRGRGRGRARGAVGIANIMVAPPMPFLPPQAHGKLIVMALLAYAGDAEAGERAVAPFRALAEPLADMVQPMPYAGLFEPAEDMEVVEESARTMFLDAVDRATAETIEHLQASTATMAVAQLRVLGGAMARVPVEATAFAHRQRRIMAGVGSVYELAQDRPAQEAWADGFAAALRQGDPGCTSTSSATRGPSGSARPIPSPPGTGWPRSSAATTRTTCSG